MVLLGLPGSGKSTLSNMLLDRYKNRNIKIFSLRKFADHYISNNCNSSLSLEIKNQRLLFGRLDGTCANKLFEFFFDDIKESDSLVILENYPLSEKQVLFLHNKVSGINAINVIYLFADNEILEKRISKRRVCFKCDKVVSVEKSYTNVDKICPICGERLSYRSDDIEIQKRIGIYSQKINKVLEVIDLKKYEIDTSSLSKNEVLNKVVEYMNWG